MKKSIRFLTLLLALLLSAGCLVSCEKSNYTVDGVEIEVSESETDYVLIDVKHYGQIVIRLYPDIAPETVANFKKLVSEKFYDGIIFHRVIEDFMIQGGDPDGDGTGGSSQTIKGEFSANGFKNTLKHTRGTVSMARTNAPDSASSQFFICHETNTYTANLDGSYAAFGYVVLGMNVVDAIAKTPTDDNDKPTNQVVMDTVRFVNLSTEAVQDVIPTTAQPLNTIAPSQNIAHDALDFSEIDPAKATVSETETDYVKITVKDRGDIILRLYPEVAPTTVANFKTLVSQKFYDGLIFHRVIEDFMIQGGDPYGTGAGGSAQKIPGEFNANGFNNNLKHVRGVISMARSNDPDSASSQFFICHATKSHLDGQYASFGYVVSGMDVVDAIASVATNSNDKPLSNVVMESVRFVTISE